MHQTCRQLEMQQTHRDPKEKLCCSSRTADRQSLTWDAASSRPAASASSARRSGSPVQRSTSERRTTAMAE